MEWTYTTYTIADYCITISLVLIAIAGVFATFFSSKKGQEFIFERVVGINPTKAHEDYIDQAIHQENVKTDPVNHDEVQSSSRRLIGQFKHRSLFYISILCCLLGGMILSITGVLIFQGCFLINVRLLSGDDCPEYPVDCFIFGKSSLSPISDNVSFVCERLSKAQFNTNISDATVWCYGWIIRHQTTKSVLDQLGVAIALIGFFTTMLAVIVYLGRCKKTIILSIMFISSCGGLIIVLLVFKWSFAPLTYAILALGVGLGIFGIVLYCNLPKPVKQKNITQLRLMNMNKTNVIAFSSALQSNQQTDPMTTTTTANNTIVLNRSAKVGPH